jgi:hypothetical protein
MDSNEGKSKMDLLQLKYFQTVTRLEHMTQAGHQLFAFLRPYVRRDSSNESA